MVNPAARATLALIILVAGVAGAHAAPSSTSPAPAVPSPNVTTAPVLRFPNRWAYYMAALSCPNSHARRVATCWNDVKQCLSGYRDDGTLIGEITNADRTAVIAHLNCGGSICYNLDTGDAFYNGRHIVQLDLKQDMRAADVAAVRAQCSAPADNGGAQ